MRWLASTLVTAALLLCGACAPTARTHGPYVANAVTASEAVDSAVGSVLLLVSAADRGHTTAAYLSVATSDAEDDASTAASTFLSIQPPDHVTEQLRASLAKLLDNANTALGDARVAARRGDRDAFVSTQPQLLAIHIRLQRFANEHG